jgi:hypothetical protein
MKRISIWMLVTACFTILPGVILAQGLGGSGTYGGSIPATFAISNLTNGSLNTPLATFGALTVGKAQALNAPTPLAFRLRSNASYILTAQIGALVGMVDGTKSVPGNADQAIQTGDIGIGFTTAVDQTGASVSGGGSGTITRVDVIPTGYDVTAGWPTVTNGDTPSFGATLHSIASAVTILSGPRISTCGDNSSTDNFLVVTMGLATMPQYLTPATTFSGTVTFTIAAGV